MFSAYAETATMHAGNAAGLDVTIPVLVLALTAVAMGVVRLVVFLQRRQRLHPTTTASAPQPVASFLEAA